MMYLRSCIEVSEQSGNDDDGSWLFFFTERRFRFDKISVADTPILLGLEVIKSYSYAPQPSAKPINLRFKPVPALREQKKNTSRSRAYIPRKKFH